MQPGHDDLELDPSLWNQAHSSFPVARNCFCFITGCLSLEVGGSSQIERLQETAIASFKLSKGHLPGRNEAAGENRSPVNCVLFRALRPY